MSENKPASGQDDEQQYPSTTAGPEDQHAAAPDAGAGTTPPGPEAFGFDSQGYPLQPQPGDDAPAADVPGQQQDFPGQHSQYGYPGQQVPPAYSGQQFPPGYPQAGYAQQGYPGQPGYPGQQVPPGYPQAGYAQQGYPGQAPYGQPPYGWGHPEQKSRVLAGLLGILLGGLGIHRFYLGHTGLAVVQLVLTLFTFGLAALWGFIEGVMILCGAQPFRTDARGIPLRE